MIKKADIMHRIICARCKKSDFVTFVPNGSRHYYCNSCLSEFNEEKQKGKIKQETGRKGDIVFSYICDICNTARKSRKAPAKVNGDIFCNDCYDVYKRKSRKSNRKNIVIAK